MTATPDKWVTVTRKSPCPVCQKPDWCRIGKVFVNCLRVPSDAPVNNGGWNHKLEGATPTRPIYRPEPPKPKLPWSAMHTVWKRGTTLAQLEDLSESLGVTVESLETIGACWAQEHRAWAFPMRLAGGVLIGFRLRPLAGKKYAVTGSTNALFMPWPLPKLETLYITEGESDLAALITIGLSGIGRPSCSSCVNMVNEFIAKHGVKRVVIVPDNDEPKERPDGSTYTPGIDGAVSLQDKLRVPSAIVMTPAKDLRESVRLGWNRQMITNALRDTQWLNPKGTNETR